MCCLLAHEPTRLEVALTSLDSTAITTASRTVSHSWLTVIDLELEADKYQDRVRSSKFVSHSSSPAPKPTAQEDEQIRAQVKRLLERTSDS